MKHYYLHHFPLSSVPSGLLKIAAFNPTAATQIHRFLLTHKDTLRLFCNARESKLASTSAKLRSSSNVTPPTKEDEETKKEETKKEETKPKKKRPLYKEPRQSSQMNSSIDEDMDA